MATRYVTPEEVAAIVGDAFLAAAVPDPDDAARWHAPTVQIAIDAVSERVDARLRGTYDLPLEDVPAFLARAVARLVHDELTDPATDTEQITRRADGAWRSVEAIAMGKLHIGAGDDDGDGRENPRTRQGQAVLVAPARAYRRSDLTGVL